MNPMLTVGVAIDDWKLGLFKTRLAEAGYECECVRSVLPNTHLLKVKTDKTKELEALVRKTNLESANSKGAS